MITSVEVDRVAEIIITATALLCAVLLLRGLFGKRLSAGVRYALWGLVLARLLLPVTFFHSPVSVMNAVPPVRSGESAYGGGPSGPAAETAGGGETGPSGVTGGPSALVTEAAGEGDAPGAGAGAVLLGIWLAGAVLVGGWFLAVNGAFLRRLRRCRTPAAGVVCPIPVYRADALPSPCLAGLLHPAVYLNRAALADPATLRHVLTHELCHKRHGDNLWALLRGLCLALWWFHPLVWLAAVLSKRDCELACDEAAVRALGEGERIPYGRTLVQMVAAKRPGPGDLLCASTAMTEGKRQIRERVVHVTEHRRMTRAALAACTALALLAGLGTFTGAVGQSAPTAMPYRVQADPEQRADALDPGGIVIPDFDWTGGEYEFAREMSIRWAEEYGRQFYALPEGSPWKAADVQVVEPIFEEPLLTLANRTDAMIIVHAGGKESAYDPGAVNEVSGNVALAVRPVGGVDAVRDLFKGGVPRGTGELSGYVILDYGFDLRREAAPAGGQQWATAGFHPGWNRNPPPAYGAWTEEDVKTWSRGLRTDLGTTAAGEGEAAWEQAGNAWAALFTGQHYRLWDQGNPAKADDVRVLSMELDDRQPVERPDTLRFHLQYAFRPVWDRELAARFMALLGNGAAGRYGEGEWEDYIIVDAAVTLARAEDAQGQEVRWRCVRFAGE